MISNQNGVIFAAVARSGKRLIIFGELCLCVPVDIRASGPPSRHWTGRGPADPAADGSGQGVLHRGKLRRWQSDERDRRGLAATAHIIQIDSEVPDQLVPGLDRISQRAARHVQV